MPPNERHELTELLASHGQAAWRLVVRILGTDGPDAADCFQQAFVELARRHQRSDDVASLPALLKRIATMRAIDTVRRRIKERDRLRPIDGAIPDTSSDPGPAALAEANEFLQDLRLALTKLPSTQAAAFVLTQVEDVSYADAALVLGVSANHLNVLLHRARASLKNLLESHRPMRSLKHE
jgi:RNA polymerase sigma-70 factor (ECF subfamily)